VKYSWTIDGAADPDTVLARPQPQLNVNRTFTFDRPGEYLIRLTVSGQRDGLLDPPDQTLVQNFKQVRLCRTSSKCASWFNNRARGRSGGSLKPPLYLFICWTNASALLT
jgi:hypothetical protein